MDPIWVRMLIWDYHIQMYICMHKVDSVRFVVSDRIFELFSIVSFEHLPAVLAIIKIPINIKKKTLTILDFWLAQNFLHTYIQGPFQPDFLFQLFREKALNHFFIGYHFKLSPAVVAILGFRLSQKSKTLCNVPPLDHSYLFKFYITKCFFR